MPAPESQRVFDAYLFVDWSARQGESPPRPCADAIWIGEWFPDRQAPATSYHQTRHAALQHVHERLAAAVARSLRVLVGFDFCYGYPSGFCTALTGEDGPQAWRTTWAFLEAEIHDTAANDSNRFLVADRINSIIGPEAAGPFWGHPVGSEFAWLRPTMPSFPYPTAATAAPLARLRLCEARLSGVQEAWKLFGVGSVGSQTLVGIPHLFRLRHAPDLGAHSRVWPFETGFDPNPLAGQRPLILHAEVWPGLVKTQVAAARARDPAALKDQVQVAELCVWAAQADARGDLGALLAEPRALAPAERRRCLEEEGWILGA